MPTRRAVLGGAAGVVLAAGAPALAAPSPADRLALFLRLKADLSGRPVPLTYRADIFLNRPDAVMPLIARVEGLSWTQAVRRGADRYEVRQIDVGRYLDPATLAPLTELQPPGATRSRVKPYRTPGTYVATPAAIEAPALAKRTDVTLSLDRGEPFVLDDEVWATEDLQTTFGGTAAGRVDTAGALHRRVSQFTTFVGAAAAAATVAPSIPMTTHALIVTDTRPWLIDLPAPLPVLWRMTGRKLGRVDTAPARVRDWLAAAHPDLLAPPWS